MGRTKPVLSTIIALATGALVAPMITAGCQAPVSPPTETKAEDTAGTTWTQVRAGGGLKSPAGTTGEILWSVVWGGGRFVAVASNGTVVHSADGVSWESPSTRAISDGWLDAITYSGGRFVAVGGEGTIAYSADGDRSEEATLAVVSERLFGLRAVLTGVVYE